MGSLCIAYRWRAFGNVVAFVLIKSGKTSVAMSGAGLGIDDANLGISEGSRRLGCSMTAVINRPWPKGEVAHG